MFAKKTFVKNISFTFRLFPSLFDNINHESKPNILQEEYSLPVVC